ncbi:MAG: translation initiation factor IF-2, partial [Verrucomicrobiales bacterium]
MPVRIYDLAKKLGMESKEVLAKAKALGITSAKVPSSSLDKITAEYLEEQLGPPKAPAAPEPARTAEPVLIVAPPEPPPVEEVEPPAPEPMVIEVKSAPAEVPPVIIPDTVVPPTPEPQHVVAEIPEPVKSFEPAVAEPLPPPAEVPAEPESVVAEAPTQETAPEPMTEAPPAPEPEVAPIAPMPIAEAPEPEPARPAAPPTPPAPPAPPKAALGSLVGRIQLPVKPGPSKPPERPPQQNRPGSAPAQQRGGQGQQGQNRQDQFRGGQRPQGQGFQGGQRPQGQGFQGRGGPGAGRYDQRGQQGGGRDAGRQAPIEPRFIPPSSGEMITMKPPIIVRDLAERLKKKPFQLIADLMALNVFATVNQAIDEIVAQKICAKYGFRFEIERRERGAGIVHAPVKKAEVDEIDDKPEDLKPRAPVVTIMGHVDHGKTTLLDVIRKASVASGEAGGITQHIGAYTISIPHPERPKDLQQITFLDTPGHAAFSAMRARGANVTDIVILVVAANDGVMPQTMEALSHAKAAKVPIIVAVNKVDHPNSNPMKVRQQLQEKGVVPEEWGGETIFQDVSALTKLGVDKLLELVVLQAEIMELKANPNRAAKGNVIESGLEPGGPTATVLVRKGTLKVGDIVLCGQWYGK